MNSQIEGLNNSSVRDAAGRKRRCLFKKDKQSFLLLLEYISFSLLQDHILIELSQSGLRGSKEEETFDEDPYLVVNPNYILED